MAGSIALSNIPAIRQALTKYGLVNLKLQNAILAVVGKESQFKPQSENLNYTTAARLKAVFSRIPDNLINSLLKNPIALGNYVYGGSYGTPANEGFLYRGRGLNQITYKNQYKTIGKALGIDLIQNPDLLNKLEYAAAALAIYYKNAITANRQKIINKYNIDLSNIKPTDSQETILKAVTNLNAGLGASQSLVNSEYGKALVYLKLINKKPVINTNKIILPLVLGAALLYFAFK